MATVPRTLLVPPVAPQLTAELELLNFVPARTLFCVPCPPVTGTFLGASFAAGARGGSGAEGTRGLGTTHATERYVLCALGPGARWYAAVADACGCSSM